MATHTHTSNPCTICGHPLEGQEAIDFIENHMKKRPPNATVQPYHLHCKGLKYDTLKKDYDTLKEQRDKCIEALSHCLIIFQSQANRGLYPLELMEEKPEFLGKKGWHFITENLKNNSK